MSAGDRPCRAGAVLVALSLALGAEAMTGEAPQCAVETIEAVRSPKNPLITPRSSETLGENINGPSVIRAPSWLAKPLGKYYMYFASHSGRHIRLAAADDLHGPWRVHEPGTLKLGEARAFKGHIASPDVHVDDRARLIRMYFHGPVNDRPGQWTGVALSKDGVGFKASDEILGKFYFRVWRWKGRHYAIAKDANSGWGELLRSESGIEPFESRGSFVRMMRHCALMLRGDRLLVFHSRKGDAPERIVLTTVELSDDWKDWKESEVIEVIRPEVDYEGTGYPNRPSSYGSATKVRQLRDPCIFEEDGRVFLFYTVAGEMGIAMAELKITMRGARTERPVGP